MIESQCTYCTLIWMFCLKQIWKELKRYNKYKTLQVVYNNYMVTYDDLLALDNKLKIHQKHLYLLRRGISLSILHVNTQRYEINSLTFRGSVLWNSLPIKFKNVNFYFALTNFALTSYCSSKVKIYRALAQSVKHKEFRLPVVLFLNFNIHV